MRRTTQGKHVEVRRRGVRLSRATVAAAVVGLAASTGITAIGAAPAQAAVVRPFVLTYDQDVFGDFLEAGNGNSACPQAAEPTDPFGEPKANCGAAQARTNTTSTGINDSYYMRWADVDDDAATYNSSTASLTVPAGATVDYARLNWSGDTGTIRLADGTVSAAPGCSTRQFRAGAGTAVLPAGTPESTSVRLKVGAGAGTAVAPQVISRDPLAGVPASQPQFYAAYATVTAQLAAAPTGVPVQLTLGNVWTPQGFGCYSGWSLVVVYKYDSANANAPLKRSVQIFDGHVRQSSADPATTVSISGLRAAASNVRVGLTAYEGDFNIVGDQFSINGSAVAEPLSTGATGNFFVSNAEGAASPSVPNNFSVDAKEFTTSLIPSGSTGASLTFSTSGDTYLAQNLVLSVPISSLDLAKVPSATIVRPGDPITYTITASNPSPAGLNDVVVSDPGFPACDRTIGGLAAGESFSYTCVVTAGAGDLANTATGTGTDTFGDPVTDTVTAATVDVINPAIDITKALTGSPPPYAPGETVYFTFSVTNTGDAPLTDVVVSDPPAPGCDRTFASLPVGGGLNWLCSTTAPLAGGTNTASVRAVDQLGGSVTDTATVSVPNAGDVAGRVFVDANGDGVFGGADTGIGDVTVALTGTDQNGARVDRTTATAADGTWSFADLVAGTYTVTETQPAAYADSTDTAGTGGVLAGDDEVTITLGDGASSTGTLFAEVAGSLSGVVYVDDDADGVRSEGEPGIPDVTVTLTGTTAGGRPLTLTTTTDANGSWTSSGVPGGTYTVTETQPAGYLDGQEAVGSAGGTAGPGADDITAITLAPGEDATGYTFGEVEPAGASGTVVDDQGDPIEGVTVTLTGTDDLGDPVSVVVVSGPTGTWAFPGLRPGTYTFTETQPAGYGAGTSTVGTAGGTATSNQITGVVLAPGSTGTGYRFVDTTGSLAGGVYVDVDVDGTRDAGEPGIAGVEVVLTATSGPADGRTATVVTGPDGSWSATGLVGGTWSLAETQPALWADGDEAVGDLGGTSDGADRIEGVVLPDGGAGTGYLFGEVGASLAGTVYTDVDGDGAIDAGEPGIAGVTVTVAGADADGDPVASRTATTDTDGTWSVPGLPAGTYSITQTQPAGYADGEETVGSAGGTAVGPDSVTGIGLTAGEAADGYDFGERLGLVTGTVFTDADRDGGRDGGETGMGGVSVALLDDAGVEIAATTTAADGSYEFADLPPGDYTVVESQPAGYGSSTSDRVDVSVDGTTGATADFGDTLGTIGDRVWSDTDRDGVQDAGEAGVGGITVELLGPGGAVVATTTTASDGSYVFAVPAGTYQVRVVLPSGTTVTQPGAGTDGSVDSDIVQATLTSGAVTLTVAPGGSVQDVDTVDAGLVPVERDLSATLTPDRSKAGIGDQVTWTVVVTDEGTVPEDGAVVVVTLPAGVVLADALGEGWTCVADGRTVTCTTTTVIPPGGQAPPLRLVTTVTAGGDKAVTVTVAPTDGSSDATPSNDAARAVVEVAAGSAPPAAAPGGRLPRTGADLVPWLGTAAVLMASGAALVVGSRRRRGLAAPVRVGDTDRRPR